MEKAKIDFIGLGAPKCATTWLTFCLEEHPEVSLPKLNTVNELNYFSNNKYNKKSEYERKGIGEYLKIMSKCDSSEGKKVGEMSTQYLTEKTAEILKKYFPNVKIILALRNPVDRAYSEYGMNKFFAGGEKGKSFVEAFYSSPEYKRRGLYYKPLKKYLELFPKKNVKVILTDDIKKNPQKIVKELYQFLEVDDKIMPKVLKEKVNEAKETRFKFVRKMINFGFDKSASLEKAGFGPIRLFLKRNLKLDKIIPIINSKNSKVMKKQKLSLEEREIIKKEFLEDIKKLEKLIGRDLSPWK